MKDCTQCGEHESMYPGGMIANALTVVISTNQNLLQMKFLHGQQMQIVAK